MHVTHNHTGTQQVTQSRESPRAESRYAVCTQRYLALRSATQHYTGLHSATQRYTVRYTARYTALHSATQHATQRYAALHRATQRYTVLKIGLKSIELTGSERVIQPALRFRLTTGH